MAKTQQISEVMTPNPVTVRAESPVVDAARAMRESDIGDVIVVKDGGVVCGIVTDRDIVVRAVAEGRDAATTRVQDICSQDLTTIAPDTSVAQAVKTMRSGAIRRLPVVEDGRPVGVVTLGDLAVEREPKSALADISGSPPNG